jgi:hypothetical protein
MYLLAERKIFYGKTGGTCCNYKALGIKLAAQMFLSNDKNAGAFAHCITYMHLNFNALIFGTSEID